MKRWKMLWNPHKMQRKIHKKSMKRQIFPIKSCYENTVASLKEDCDERQRAEKRCPEVSEQKIWRRQENLFQKETKKEKKNLHFGNEYSGGNIQKRNRRIQEHLIYRAENLCRGRRMGGNEFGRTSGLHFFEIQVK